MKKNSNHHAVILAGGSGTRFWPMSRKANPKQFLNITGNTSLLQETLKRIRSKIPAKNVLIVTNRNYASQIRKQVKAFKIPLNNILYEPEGKNTAPAVCWAAAKIYHANPQAIMAVLPSDHLILKTKKYLNCLSRAFQLASKNYLVTFGIQPTRPETGYGYLKTATAESAEGKRRLHRDLRSQRLPFAASVVAEFTEKPNLAKAKQFIRNKNYYWNSGMFIWKTEIILNEFKRHQPKIYKLVGEKYSQKYINRVWKKLPSISIDYGILEKAKNVAAIPALNIGWSDLGSWESLTEVLAKDKKNNIFKGDVININSNSTFIWGQKRCIAAIGLKNLIVIDTPDALLICPKDQSQNVKDIVTFLQKSKRPEF